MALFPSFLPSLCREMSLEGPSQMPSDRHGAARQFAIVAAVGACVALITPADAFACGVRMKLGRQNLQATPLCAIGPRAEAAEAGLERRALLRAFVGTGLALAESWPTEVFAERTFESMKKSKASYLPRLKTGVTFYEGPLREAIDENDWETVSKAVKEKGEAWKLAHLDKYSSGVVGEVVELKGPLKVFASSITASDSETKATQKLYAYLSKYAEFNDRLAEAASAGNEDAALQAWKGGCVALRLYVETLNKEIPRSVGKISLPDPPYGKIEIPSTATSETSTQDED